MAGIARLTVTAGGILALAAVALTGCSSGDPLGGGSATTAPGAAATSGSGTKITVGSAAFPEDEILAYVYAYALQANGIDASVSANIGATHA